MNLLVDVRHIELPALSSIRLSKTIRKFGARFVKKSSQKGAKDAEK
jgi:hypothetical protein